ncbi:MAG: hypothetical protein V4808_16475 [Pseudomonadota bacterium]
MAKRIFLRFICAISLFLLFPMHAIAQKDKEYLTSETFTIAAPEGLLTFRYDTYETLSRKRRHALTDASGRKLVGGNYFSIDPINSRQALVATKIPEGFNKFSLAYRLYTFGKGEGPLLDYRYVTYIGNEVRRYYALNEDRTRVTLFSTKGERVFDLPGGVPHNKTALTMRGNVALLAFMGDGREYGRILTPDGDFISPAIGEISEAKTYRQRRFENKMFSGDTALSNDIITLAVDAFVGPGWGTSPLYVPIDDSGAPLPMPPGVVGISPVVDNGTWTIWKSTRVWSVLFQEPSGLVTGAILPGSLADVLRMAPTAPRFRTWDFQSDTNLIHAQQMDGSWIVMEISSGTPILYPNMKTGGYASRSDLHAAYTVGRAAEVAEIYARSAAELAAYQEQARLKAVERYAKRRAEGQPCAPGVIADAFAGGRDTATQYFRECPSQIDAAAYEQGRTLGVSTGAFAVVDAYWVKRQQISREAISREVARELAARDLAARNRGPVSSSIGSTDYSNAAREQWNNYAARANATSQSNFKAYTSGAQKWCC